MDPRSHARVSRLGPACGQCRYVFKTADAPSELADVHGLLYRTFVLEIPRYDDPGANFLIDKYHDRNRYFVALRDGRVCGVTAVHDRPPFSVAAALASQTTLDNLGPRLIEARILAVEPQERFGVVFAGLACLVHDYAKSTGCQHIVITGLSKRRKMYERMGFRPLGPSVLRGREQFLPMSLDLSELPGRAKRSLCRWRRR